MKKLLSLMFCVMMFTAALAQTESGHLTFKGVHIDGSMKSFVEKMKEKGFTYQTTFNGVVMMKGAFSGYEDCNISIFSTKQSDLVYTVGVNLSASNSWYVLSSSYFKLKEQLTIKYGEPSECTETFDAYSQPDDDQTKMLYVNMDKCKYQTVFTTSKGVIKLIISHIRVDYQDSCYVSLIYIDGINYFKNESEDIDDL